MAEVLTEVSDFDAAASAAARTVRAAAVIMAEEAAVQAGLDYVFSFYEQRYQRQLGKFDREVRHPEVFLTLATEAGLLPVAARTVLVTGSKGKGTCARLVAHYLQQAGYRVGLVLTPEELTHLDRIRLNGVPIAPHDFNQALATLKPALERHAAVAHPDFYHPPTAIFLLIALRYFQHADVDYMVIEGGRGAQFDEIGQIPAALGIVTSILPEHLRKLGPSVADICHDKFSLTRNCEAVLASPQAYEQAHAMGMPPATLARVRVAAPALARSAALADAPAWFETADSLARQALTLLGVAHQPDQANQLPHASRVLSASCQVIDAKISPRLAHHAVVFLDGAISPACLDLVYLRSPQCQPHAIVIGLTADKDVDGMVQFLGAHGFSRLFFFHATSGLGDLGDHDGAVGAARADLPLSGKGSHWLGVFDKKDGLDAASSAALIDLARRYERIYVIGVQVFLRAVRQALGVKSLSGDSDGGKKNSVDG